MKNIHLLPTDKPSRLLKTMPKGNLILSKSITSGSHWENQHIYITSDEEIKEDWTLDQDLFLSKIDKEQLEDNSKETIQGMYKKIILTTDQDLIKDGVQAIDDEFLQWFVKNPSCESVEVKNEWNEERIVDGKDIGDYSYKIIIPQEEPKQDYSGVHFRHCYQGEYEDGCKYGENDCPAKPLEPKHVSLEQAAESRYGTDMDSIRGSNVYDLNTDLKRGFIAGAKWQQERMYSEEEVISLIQFLSMNENFMDYTSVSKDAAKYYLEQFKKK